MATQRLTVAVLAGASADVAAALFGAWRVAPQAPDTVDRFCEVLRQHSTALPVIYFCEWVDRWMMGNLVPGPGAVEGRRFQAAYFSPEEARTWADQCGNQWPEQEWFAARLREAAEAWGLVVDRRAVVVIRAALDSSATDEDVRATSEAVPDWLAGIRTSA